MGRRDRRFVLEIWKFRIKVIFLIKQCSKIYLLVSESLKNKRKNKQIKEKKKQLIRISMGFRKREWNNQQNRLKKAKKKMKQQRRIIMMRDLKSILVKKRKKKKR